LIPDFQYPHRVQRVGTSCDGGKWVCGLGRPAKQARCVIYSVDLVLLFLRFCGADYSFSKVLSAFPLTRSHPSLSLVFHWPV
ncbi:hypothetical protein EDB89DRAFT_1854909, partial [Lactarius sanguifluus]